MTILLRLLNPNLQPCIHCKAAEAIKQTLYCQSCLDALGQEWLRNYELGVLHSTLPAFFEAVAMIARSEREVEA